MHCPNPATVKPARTRGESDGQKLWTKAVSGARTHLIAGDRVCSQHPQQSGRAEGRGRGDVSLWQMERWTQLEQAASILSTTRHKVRKRCEAMDGWGHGATLGAIGEQAGRKMGAAAAPCRPPPHLDRRGRTPSRAQRPVRRSPGEAQAPSASPSTACLLLAAWPPPHGIGPAASQLPAGLVRAAHWGSSPPVHHCNLQPN